MSTEKTSKNTIDVRRICASILIEQDRLEREARNANKRLAKALALLKDAGGMTAGSEPCLRVPDLRNEINAFLGDDQKDGDE